MNIQQHTPGPACAAFAPQLTQLADGDLRAEDAPALTAHLATCAYCQREYRAQARLNAALRHSFVAAPIPYVTTEDIIRQLHDLPTATRTPAFAAGSSARSVARGANGRRVAPTLHPTPNAPRGLALFGPIAAVVLIVLLVTGLFGGRLFSHGRQVTTPTATTPTPLPIVGLSRSLLQSVSMTSPTEGWAVGNRSVANQQGVFPVLYHDAHGRWAPVALSQGGALSAVAMVSASDGWAFGTTAILHYDGTRWQAVETIASPQASSWSIQMLSATDGWAVAAPGALVGAQANSGDILHYDGSSWKQYPTPQVSGSLSLESVSFASPTEGWAVGQIVPTSNQLATGVLLHYGDGQWQIAQTIPQADVYSVSMVSPTEGWATGKTYTLESSSEGSRANPAGALLLQYSGGKWVAAASNPATAYGYGATLETVTFRSPTDGWIIGSPGVSQSELLPNGESVSIATLLYHYIAGRWVLVQAPISTIKDNINLSSITPYSNGDLWAVGSASVPTGQTTNNYQLGLTLTPFIAHYHAGKWSVAVQ